MMSPARMRKCCQRKEDRQLQCDVCCTWVCLRCVAGEDGWYMTDELYEALKEKKSFPWKCSGCSNVNPIDQFVASKLFTRSELRDLGISGHLLKGFLSSIEGEDGGDSYVQSSSIEGEGDSHSNPMIQHQISTNVDAINHSNNFNTAAINANNAPASPSALKTQFNIDRIQQKAFNKAHNSIQLPNSMHNITTSTSDTPHNSNNALYQVAQSQSLLLSSTFNLPLAPVSPTSTAAIPPFTMSGEPSKSHQSTVQQQPTPTQPAINVNKSISTTVPYNNVATHHQSVVPVDPMMSILQQFMSSMQEERAIAREERREAREQLNRLIAVIEKGSAQSITPHPDGQDVAFQRNTAPMPEFTSTLPKVEMPKFSGKVLEWPYFWQSFELNVHSRRNLSDGQKLDYLRQLLQGPAFDKIRGLGFSGLNYSEAVRILQSHYADDDIQRQAAWNSLHSLPRVNNDLSNLEKFTDEARSISAVLISQGYISQTIDTLVPTLMSKIPDYLITKFQESRIIQDKSTVFVTLNDLIDYMDKYVKIQRQKVVRGEVENKTTVPQAGATQRSVGGDAQFKSQSRFQNTTTTTSAAKQMCVFCGDTNHYSDECRKYMNVADRKEIVWNKKLCVSCLAPGHTSRSCYRRKVCFYCRRNGHHSALCSSRAPVKTVQHNVDFSLQPEGYEEDFSDAHVGEDPKQATFAISNSSDGDVFLALFPGQVHNPVTNTTKHLNIYLDHGARFTCISERAANLLGLQERKRLVIETTRFGTNKPEKIGCGLVSFEIRGKSGYSVKLEAYKIRNMTPPLTSDPHGLPDRMVKKLEPFELLNAPRKETNRQSIDILVGMDYWYDFLGPQYPATKVDSRLYVHHSPMGNILCGSHIAAQRSHLNVGSSNTSMFCTLSTRAQRDVDQLWSLEAIGIKDAPNITVSDDKIRNSFEETIQRRTDGRYEVVFPWKQAQISLGSNLFLARKRLSYTVKQLAPVGQVTSHLLEYHKIIDDQLKKEVIEKVSFDQQPDGHLVHYIAHFPVIKSERVTTKVRIVYDASAKTKIEHKCLNDFIHPGPCQLSDLVGMLLRFRMPKYAITSDIEKAFLQVGLQRQDRDCTRFLWLKDPHKLFAEDNIQPYRFTRIPFGIVASPYLLGATIKHHLTKYNNDTVNQMVQNIYVDNIFMWSESTTESLLHYKTAKGIFGEACMNLREFCSNNKEFIEQLPESDRDTACPAKVLGIIWDTDNDQIKCKVKSLDCDTYTKRTALKTLASVFDPLGLLSPLAIRAKIIQQEIWEGKYDWDDDLPAEIISKLRTVFSQLSEASSISIPRRVQHNDGNCDYKLVCFSDASGKAYGVCVYLVADNGSSRISNLIYAKARVCPLKPVMSIPKLELLAAQIGARALRFVFQELKITAKCYHFIDSQVVLHWILSSKDYSSYISRRRNEILTGSPCIVFNYVQTKENPADLTSRGCSYPSLDSFWFRGPDWLTKSDSFWPEQYLPENHSAVEAEAITSDTNMKRRTKIPIQTDSMMLSSRQVPVPPLSTTVSPFGMNIDEYSSLDRLLAVTSFCRRFVSKHHHKDLVITAEERLQALKSWISVVQCEMFSDEMSTETNRPSQLKKRLDIFKDSNNILRCGGRMANAPLSFDQKYPYLIPKDHQLTRLIVLRSHKEVSHFGAKATLAAVRQQFWIPHGLSAVKKIIRSCVLCRKLEGKGFRLPRMGQLPKERLTRASAFQFVGLDYAGPLMIRNQRASVHEKRWIAVFVCFVTRAVHLEIVPSCETASVLMAMKRFVARRGNPEMVISDNAMQFKSASREVGQIDAEDSEMISVRQFFSKRGIMWRFNPEASPWVGGFYERLIGLIKRALRKTLFKITATDEILNTVILEIEAVINTRPLLQPQPNIKDDEVLTPAHLISTSSQLCMKPHHIEDDPDYTPTNLTKKHITTFYKQGTHKLDAFWRLWQRQYLSTLREYHQLYFKRVNGEVDRTPKIGEVVLLMEDSARSTWKMGLVKSVYTSVSDGERRFVEVELANGNVVKRSVSMVVPLEVV